MTRLEKDKNEGEKVFEQYLLSQGLDNFEFEKHLIGKNKRPDYFLKYKGQEILLEVKEFDRAPLPTEFKSFDPTPLIQRKIDKAREKFKEFKDWPCCLVLYNNGNASATIEMPYDLLGSMYGQLGISFSVDSENNDIDEDSFDLAFGNDGKMFRPNMEKPFNTTISAIITLRYVHLREGDKLGVIVFENIFANKELPSDLFCGEYDVRYGRIGNSVGCIFKGAKVQHYN